MLIIVSAAFVHREVYKATPKNEDTSLIKTLALSCVNGVCSREIPLYTYVDLSGETDIEKKNPLTLPQVHSANYVRVQWNISTAVMHSARQPPHYYNHLGQL